MVDREGVGQGDIRACQLGRQVMGQCMYRGTVDGVEDKEEDGLLVVASHFVLFLLRLRQTIDTGTVLIVITMFQIQCRNVCEGDGWLLEWWREKTGWSFALRCAGGRTVASMWWS